MKKIILGFCLGIITVTILTLFNLREFHIGFWCCFAAIKVPDWLIKS